MSNIPSAAILMMMVVAVPMTGSTAASEESKQWMAIDFGYRDTVWMGMTSA